MKTPPPVDLSRTCDELTKLLSTTSPFALMTHRSHLVDLVRGVGELAARVQRLEERPYA